MFETQEELSGYPVFFDYDAINCDTFKLEDDCLIQCDNDILGNATTVMMPKDPDHKGGRTYKKKNNKDQIVKDSKDLNKAKNKDS